MLDDRMLNVMSSMPLAIHTVVVSPHFDDAALSASSRLLIDPANTLVLTVHGGSPQTRTAPAPWDRMAGFVDSAEAAEVRADEDERSCNILQVRSRRLDYADSPYLDEPVDVEVLAKEISEVVGDARTVLAPAGIGWHTDHVRVRDAVLAGVDTREKDVWLYADSPYAMHVPGWGTEHYDLGTADEREKGALELLASKRPIGRPSVIALDDSAWIRKRSAVLAHASQMSPLGAHFPGFSESPGPLRHELFWPLVPHAGPADWQASPLT